MARVAVLGRRVVMIASAGVSVLYIVLCAVFSVLFTRAPEWIAHLRIRIATLRLWILALSPGAAVAAVLDRASEGINSAFRLCPTTPGRRGCPIGQGMSQGGREA
ncbi:hypothetical protein [Frankia sp. CiP3]|uniref:hypothetical protein n=1 Tax=Frankia sp. CiP3 TaxID=2880971 RepID=UPI001EF6131C|nr:hypothetical protein [Frankia sp. CiP3]